MLRSSSGFCFEAIDPYLVVIGPVVSKAIGRSIVACCGMSGAVEWKLPVIDWSEGLQSRYMRGIYLTSGAGADGSVEPNSECVLLRKWCRY